MREQSSQPNHEAERQRIRDKISRTIGKASLKNAVAFTASTIGLAMGGGVGSAAETVHDAGDAVLHGVEYAGSRQQTERRMQAARVVAGSGVTLLALYVGIKSGVDLANQTGETPGVFPTVIQAGVSAYNIDIHNSLDDDMHDVEHEIGLAERRGVPIDDLKNHPSLQGAHAHTLSDKFASPLLTAGMVASEATGDPMWMQLAAAGGAGITMKLNGQLVLRQLGILSGPEDAIHPDH